MNVNFLRFCQCELDYMKANAELRNKAGLKCYIKRETNGKCCEWCTKMAGRYAYPDDTPMDVFRHHDNCGCSVTYKNGRQRQDVWSKKTWEADKDERINKASGKEPTAFTKAEAQAKQSEILARKELTYGAKDGIIQSNKLAADVGFTLGEKEAAPRGSGQFGISDYS